MAAVRSAGILLYRRRPELQVLIAHMGGPFWARKDEAAWSIPKGLVEETDVEGELVAAAREFAEELGSAPPSAEYVLLGEFRQPSGKTIVVFAAEADFPVDAIASNTFTLEWPPHSGTFEKFPEVDDARWFEVEAARPKLVKGQRPILDALTDLVA